MWQGHTLLLWVARTWKTCPLPADVPRDPCPGSAGLTCNAAGVVLDQRWVAASSFLSPIVQGLVSGNPRKVAGNVQAGKFLLSQWMGMFPASGRQGPGLLNSAVQEAVYTTKKYPSNNANCAPRRNASRLRLSNLLEQGPWSPNPINTHFWSKSFICPYYMSWA